MQEKKAFSFQTREREPFSILTLFLFIVDLVMLLIMVLLEINTVLFPFSPALTCLLQAVFVLVLIYLVILGIRTFLNIYYDRRRQLYLLAFAAAMGLVYLIQFAIFGS